MMDNPFIKAVDEAERLIIEVPLRAFLAPFLDRPITTVDEPEPAQPNAASGDSE